MGIKILFHNTLRTFIKKVPQLLSISIIIFLSSYLYFTVSYAYTSLEIGVDKVITGGNQEDFIIEVLNGITTSEMNYVMRIEKGEMLTYSLTELRNIDKKLYDNILKERIKAFQDIYEGYGVEVREYKDINFKNDEGKGNKLRILKEQENINKIYIEQGRMPKKKNEIAVCKSYAEGNNLKLGDQISIKGDYYTITAFVIFPDYTLPMFGNDMIFDASKISVALVNDKAYERIHGESGVYLSGLYKKSLSEGDFQKSVIDTYKDYSKLDFILNITETRNVVRSGAIIKDIETSKATILSASIMIVIIAVMVIIILIYKILKGEKVQIGVLKALGYSVTEITLPYVITLFMISVTSLALGCWAGSASAIYYRDMYLKIYLLPNEAISNNWMTIIEGVGIPLCIILVLCTWIIRKQLSKRTLALLKVEDKGKISRLSRIVSKLLKNVKIQTRYKYVLITKNIGKFLVFFISISSSIMLMVMSFMLSGCFNKLTIDSYKSVDYVYEGYLDLTKSKPRLSKQDEKFLIVNNALYEEDTITLKGLEKDNKLHKLYTSKKEDITYLLTEGAIINKSFSIMYDVEQGDIVQVKLEDEEYSLKVVAICKDYGDPIIYTDITTLSKMVTKGKSNKYYNGVYSINPLNEKLYASVSSKEDIMNQSAMMQGFVEMAIYMLIFTAVGIAILVLYILTTLTVEDNYYNISMLKVMGYSKKEVEEMILGSYRVLLIMTYMITVPCTVWTMNICMDYMAKLFNMVIPLELETWHAISGLLCVFIMFEVGAYAAKKKVNKIALQEVLKAYRE